MSLLIGYQEIQHSIYNSSLYQIKLPRKYKAYFNSENEIEDAIIKPAVCFSQFKGNFVDLKIRNKKGCIMTNTGTSTDSNKIFVHDCSNVGGQIGWYTRLMQLRTVIYIYGLSHR